jgi:hypothetical protein
MAKIPTSGEMRIVIEMPGEVGGDVPKNGGDSPANPVDESATSKNPTKGTDRSQVALATAIQATKTIGTQAANAAISCIGLATGNNYAQAQAERTMSAVSSITALAISAANPVTLGITVATMAISVGTEYYKQQKEREIENHKTEQYARRLGYTVGRK